MTTLRVETAGAFATTNSKDEAVRSFVLLSGAVQAASDENMTAATAAHSILLIGILLFMRELTPFEMDYHPIEK